MSSRNRLVLRLVFSAITLSALAVLAGCGSSSVKATAPPTGGFSDSNLNGTYVFSAAGADGNGYFIAFAGTFMANGSGGITGGTVDVNSNDPGIGPLLELSVTGGSYSVGVDGRPSNQAGLLTLQTASGNFTFDFVLSTSEHGLITEFDDIGSASGTLDLQANVTQANINGQSYAFSFTGSAGNSSVICTVNFAPSVPPVPFASAGAFTMDASDPNLSSGVVDFNNNCLSTGVTNLPITSGSVTMPTTAGTAGTASFTSSAGTFAFDVFPVDATHLKFIEVDALPIVVGDAFTLGSSVNAGNNVITLGGLDETNGNPFAAGGLLVTDGNGNITNASVEDFNDGGTPGEVTSNIGGTYSALTGGRSVLTLTSGFVNGNGGLGCSNCQFALYPFTNGGTNGMFLLQIDNAGTSGGAGYAQSTSNTTLASGEGYGVNLSGTANTADGVFEEDDIAEFTNTNGNLAGIIDFNDQGQQTSFDQRYASTYTADTTVTGRGTISNQTGENAYLLTTYVIDASNVAVVSTDPNFVGIGTFSTQAASSKANVAQAHLAVLEARGASRKAVKKH